MQARATPASPWSASHHGERRDRGLVRRRGHGVDNELLREAARRALIVRDCERQRVGAWGQRQRMLHAHEGLPRTRHEFVLRNRAIRIGGGRGIDRDRRFEMRDIGIFRKDQAVRIHPAPAVERVLPWHAQIHECRREALPHFRRRAPLREG